MLRFLLIPVLAITAWGHAPPTRIAKGPLHVENTRLVDAEGHAVELVGANVPAPTEMAFKVLRQRWNMNATRISVSADTWLREGDSYIAQIARSIEDANRAGLVVILAARENGEAGMPSQSMLLFWKAWAERFRETPSLIFDVYDKPSAHSVPGVSVSGRRSQDWQFWLEGGVSASGATVSGMRQMVATIRSAGATQVIAVQAFADIHGFEGLLPVHQIPDANVVYEVHPHFDVAVTNVERDRKFGFLTSRVPVFAGEWGLILDKDTPACQAVPRDLDAAANLVNQTLQYFFDKHIIWTAAAFEPGSLVRDADTYRNTRLSLWQCGEADPKPGMGELVLLFLTGDPTGFGELLSEGIVNSATFTQGPVAPGQNLTIYGYEMGPYPAVEAQVDATGALPASLGGVQVTFDGIAAPIFSASAYQHYIQVPYSIADRETTIMQIFYNGVPSSEVTMPVAGASPGVYADFTTRVAKAINQDGTVNSSLDPASAGSVVALYTTGLGMLTPRRAAGIVAQAPVSEPVLRVSATIAGSQAEVLYAGEVAGYIGIQQVNVRVPEAAASRDGRSVTRQLFLSAGPHTSSAPVTIWVR